MSSYVPEFSVSVLIGVVRQTGGDESGGSESGGSESGGDLVSDLGNEIRVTVDRWSAGQLGLSDIVAAGAVVVAGFCLAWLARRLVHRAGRNLTGPALTALGTVGQLTGGAIVLLATALALEILGFSLSPILILILIVVVALLLLRPIITNLTSGLLLQVRGALDVGDLVETTGGVMGVVNEITTRTLSIDTADGRRVHVPNSDVLNGVIVNYTTRGCWRSSFELTVGSDEDLDLVVSTIRDALEDVAEISDDPSCEVEIARVTGRLVTIRALIWHEPELAARRAAIHAGIGAALTDLRRVGIELDGPTLVELASEHPDEASHDAL
jgi:small-conductance mechanosensitive channel